MKHVVANPDSRWIARERLHRSVLPLLVKATKQNVLHWKPAGTFGEAYSTKANGLGPVFLRLAWLQRKDGGTIDPQLAVLVIGGCRLIFPYGSKAIQLVAELMNAGISPTAGYPASIPFVDSLESTLNSKFARFDMKSVKRYDLVLRGLRVILLGTVNQKLRWKRQRHLDEENEECYFSNFQNHQLLIQLFSPLISEHAVLRGAVARVHFNGFFCDFAAGTEGRYIVDEILAAGSRIWRKRLDSECLRLRNEIETLRGLLK